MAYMILMEMEIQRLNISVSIVLLVPLTSSANMDILIGFAILLFLVKSLFFPCRLVL
jgi:hypothetical protein